MSISTHIKYVVGTDFELNNFDTSFKNSAVSATEKILNDWKPCGILSKGNYD